MIEFIQNVEYGKEKGQHLKEKKKVRTKTMAVHKAGERKRRRRRFPVNWYQ